MMGFFDRFRKPSDAFQSWDDAIAALYAGDITIRDFLRRTKTLTVYYSTPFGENTNGEAVPWIHQDQEHNALLFPVFTDKDQCDIHFKEAGRASFMIIEGTLSAARNGLDATPALRSVGLLLHSATDSVAIMP